LVRRWSGIFQWDYSPLVCFLDKPLLMTFHKHVHVCYVWFYHNWFFVFDCICDVLRGSLLYISCGLSAVEINELLLLLLLLLLSK